MKYNELEITLKCSFQKQLAKDGVSHSIFYSFTGVYKTCSFPLVHFLDDSPAYRQQALLNENFKYQKVNDIYELHIYQRNCRLSINRSLMKITI